LNANFRGKGAPPPTIFGVRKLESLAYRTVKKIAENFNRLSRAHQRYRQTTDGIAIAYSERNVVTFAKKTFCFQKLTCFSNCTTAVRPIQSSDRLIAKLR